MKNSVIQAARAAERQMHGRIDIDSLISYIQSRGYVVLFYDPEKEHPVLEMHELSDYAKTVNGFTLVHRSEKYVFVNESRDSFAQLGTLAHEAGHVARKHVERGKVRNKAFEEREAETFAYILLYCPRKRFIRCICSAFNNVHSLIKDYYTELKGALQE